MRRPLLLMLVFVVLLATPSLIRYLTYYQLNAPRRAVPTAFDPAAVAAVPTPAANAFVDEPTSQSGQVLVDLAHRNQFTFVEIGSLDARLAQRGYQLVHYSDGDLQTSLRSVDGFIVIAPLDTFSTDEIRAVADFVRRGGKLLLLGDPTRFSAFLEETEFSFEVIFERDEIPLNSLSNEFGIIFNGDYLYNMVENEGNFRNIILERDGFGETAVTANLDQVVFYGAHSLEIGPEALPLFAGGDNTWSSATDRPGGLLLGAMSKNGQVLALGDLTFLEDPYSNVLDNGRLIAQIADFLTQPTERHFILSDFPYFFGEEIDLIYTGAPQLGPDAFDEIIQLQEGFRQVGKSLTLAAQQSGNEALVLGLYNQAEQVSEQLETAGIRLIIEPQLEQKQEDGEAETLTEDQAGGAEDKDETDSESAAAEEASDASETEADVENEQNTAPEQLVDETPPDEVVRLIESRFGQIQMSGTALIVLHDGENGRQLIVLAASKAGLENTIDRLLSMTPADAENALADCLLNDTVAFCPTDIPSEAVEAELKTGGEVDPLGEENEESGGLDDEKESVIDDENETDKTHEIEAIDQGNIEIGDTISTELAAEERHAYTFSQGPATITITVTGDSEMDTILELYNPDNELIESSDSTFSEGIEKLTDIEVGSGDYTITVRDFFDNGGGYEIAVMGTPIKGDENTPTGDENDDTDEPVKEPDDEGEEEIITESRVFIFVDDDGKPLGDSTNSVDVLTAGFAAYETTVWISTEDGPLTLEALQGHQLLVWDSGNYEDEEGFFGDDFTVIIEFMEVGEADIFVTGTIPAAFAGSDIVELEEVVFVESGSEMDAGLPIGDTLSLDNAAKTISSELTTDDEEDGIFPMMTNPNSDFDDKELVAFAGIDEFSGSEQKSIFILFPISALPSNIQEQLLENAIIWFGLE